MPSSPESRLSHCLDIELLSLLRGSQAIDIEICALPYRAANASVEWNRESLAHFCELRRTGNLDNPDKVAITSAAEAEVAVEGCFEKRFVSQVALGVLCSPSQREHSFEKPFSMKECDASSRLGDLSASASPLNSPFSSLPQWLGWEHKREIAQAQDKLSSCNAREIAGIDIVFDRSSSSELKQDRKGCARTLLPLLDLSAGGNNAELLKEGSRTTLLRFSCPRIDSESFSFIPPHSQHQQLTNLSPLLSTHLARVLLLASEQFFSGSVADTSLKPKNRREIICNRVIKKRFFS